MTPEEIRATLLEVLLEVEEATLSEAYTSKNMHYCYRRDALRRLIGTPKPPTPAYHLPPAKPVTVDFEVPRDALPKWAAKEEKIVELDNARKTIAEDQKEIERLIYLLQDAEVVIRDFKVKAGEEVPYRSPHNPDENWDYLGDSPENLQDYFERERQQRQKFLQDRLGAVTIDTGTKIETPPRPNPLPAGYAPGRDGLRVGMRFRQTNKYIEVLEIKEDTAVVRITDKKDAPFVDQWGTRSLGHMFLCEPFKYEDK
jgi:hypothetical protein